MHIFRTRVVDLVCCLSFVFLLCLMQVAVSDGCVLGCAMNAKTSATDQSSHVDHQTVVRNERDLVSFILRSSNIYNTEYSSTSTRVLVL